MSGKPNITNYSHEKGLTDTKVFCVYQDSDHFLWFGTSKGLFKFNGFEFYRPKNSEITNNKWIKAFASKDGKTLSVASYKGLFHLDAQGKWSKDTLFKSTEKIVDIIYDQQGRFWVGTPDGVFYKNPGETEYVKYTQSKSLMNLRIFTIAKKNDESIWLGTNNGVYIIKDDSLKVIKEKDGLIDNMIITIKHHGKETWVGSRNGLSHIENDRITNFTTEDGLISNFIRSIAIAEDGTVWLGTFHGICKITGNKIEHYTVKDGLLSDHIESIIIDKDNNTWVTSTKGITKIRDDEFILIKKAEDNLFNCLSVSDNDKIHIGLKQGYTVLDKSKKQIIRRSYYSKIRSMLKSNGKLYIGTLNGLVIKDLHNQSKDKVLLKDFKIYSIYASRDNRLWIGTNKGLFVYYNKILHDLTTPSNGINLRINHITRDNDDNMWFASEKGVFSYDGIEFTKFLTKDGLIDDFSTALMKDHQGSIWQGSRDGVSIYRNGKWTRSPHKELTNIIINTIFEDSKERIWIGTWKGLYLLEGNKIRRFSQSKIINTTLVNHIAEDKEGNLWIGTNKGLFHYDNKKVVSYHYYFMGSPKPINIKQVVPNSSREAWIGAEANLSYFNNGKFENYQKETNHLSTPCYAIKAKDSTLWLGTKNGLIKKVNNKTIKIFTIKEGLPSNYIRKIVLGPDNTTWAITNKTLSYIKNDSVLHFRENHLFKKRKISDIAFSKDGTLWIGTNAGLFYKKNNDKTKPFQFPGFNLSTCVRRLLINHQGDLLIASTEGLHVFNGFYIVFYTAEDYLLDNEVYSICEDKNHHIWLGSWEVLSRFDGKDFYHYQKQEGISDELIIDLTADKKGNLWVLSKNKLIRFQTSLKESTKKAPPVFINHIFVNGIPYDTSGKVNFFKNSQNNFFFRFIGLEFSYPRKVKYEYRLKGLKSKWDQTTSSNVNYTFLPPGDYTFEVAAINHRGLKSVVPACFSFTIDTPYWRKWWFITSILIFLGIILFSILSYWRLKTIRKMNVQLELMVKNKTRELKKANSKLNQMANHDMMTGLPNYRNFASHYEEEWNRCLRASQPLTILMMDIDNFKIYNDTYGHQQGDLCLKSVSKVIKNSVNRAGELVARYGGEEFVAILPNIDKAKGLELAKKINREVNGLLIKDPVKKAPTKVSISIGVASFTPYSEKNKEDLLRMADQALYQAKAAGRNTVMD